MADGNTEEAFNCLQNFRFFQGVQIIIQTVIAMLLHMAANAFFDAFSHPGIASPGKAETVEELSERIIIHMICD
jgi:hypothetical protein